MSDTERPATHRDRRAPQAPRARSPERTTTHSDRRNRSRSPRAPRRDTTRYRSRSPLRRSTRGPSPNDRARGRTNDTNTGPRTSRAPARTAPSSATSKDAPMTDVPRSDAHRPEGVDDESWAVQQAMGFGGFKSTKNTKVPGNERNYGVRRDKTMEARQYMNRQGGFNRPLSPGRV